MNVAYSTAVVFAAKLISAGISALIPDTGVVLHMLHTFFGSEYVWITTVAMACATWGEKQTAKLAGSQEIGTYFIYLFLFVIGVPASISKILTETPLLLAFTAIMVCGRQAAALRPGGHHSGLQCQYRRTHHRRGHGDFPGLERPGGAGHAGGYFWLCDWYLPGHSGRRYFGSVKERT